MSYQNTRCTPSGDLAPRPSIWLRLRRVLVAAACLALPPGSAYAGCVETSLGTNLLYCDDISSWQNAANQYAGSYQLFETTAANIAKANTVSSPPSQNQDLGNSLPFYKLNIGTCQSLYLETPIDAPLAGFIFEDAESGTLQFGTDSLSIGDVNNYENDDFNLVFYQEQPLAVGFRIIGNTYELFESIRVYSSDDPYPSPTIWAVLNMPDQGVSGIGSFVGFVSTNREGISSVRVDENTGGDDIAMADVWLGPNATSQSGDADGLPDCDEVNLYGTDPVDIDTDNDNLLDGWEVVYGFDPVGTDESALDPDFDLLTNLQEQAAGTLPQNPDKDGDTLLDGAELANAALGYDPFVVSNLRPSDIEANGNIVGPGVDLSDADLAGADLTGADLTGATLKRVSGQLAAASGVILPTGYRIVNNYIVGPSVNLTDANLTGADLTGADLTGANLTGATLTGVSGQLLDASGAILPTGYIIVNSYIVGPSVNLAGADLTGANLTGATLDLVSGQLAAASGVILPTGYRIVNNYIVGPSVNLTDANLTGADFTGADLTGANLTGATLTGVSGQMLYTSGAILPTGYIFVINEAEYYIIVGPGADLRGADLYGADLTGADLTGADLTGATLMEVSGQLFGAFETTLPNGYIVANNYIVGPGVNLKDADLAGADLTGADLELADLTGATLTRVSGQLFNTLYAILPTGYKTVFSLSGYYLIVGPGVDLTGADLYEADLTGADLTGADLTGATLMRVSGQLAAASGVILPTGYRIVNNYIVGFNVSLVGADLTGADLTAADLAAADLTGATLTGADLTDAALELADLTGATLTGVSGQLWSSYDVTLPTGYFIALNYIVGPGVDLTGAELYEADLTGADLMGADLTLVNLSGADLTGADLTGADLTDAFLGGATLTGVSGQLAAASGVILSDGYSIVNNYIVGPSVNLTDANFTGAILTEADLTGANLTGADLTGATLTGVSGQLLDASGAILPAGYIIVNNYIVGPYVNLTGADLTGADLTGATLDLVSGQLAAASGVILPTGYRIVNNYIVGPYVNLTGADLTGADLTGADLTGADLTGAILTLANLTNAVGLDTTVGPATYFNTDFTGTGFDPVAAGWTLCTDCRQLGDLAPRGSPDNLVNVGDLLIMMQMVTGVIEPTAVETEVGDVDGDGDLDIADLLLLQQNLLGSPGS